MLLPGIVPYSLFRPVRARKRLGPLIPHPLRQCEASAGRGVLCSARRAGPASSALRRHVLKRLMLQKTPRLSSTTARTRDHAPLTIRRTDAIPVALPLKAAMKMAGETITAAQNILIRIEAQDGTVGWGEAASAPTMTGDTLGGLTAAVRDYLAPRLIGQDARQWDALRLGLHKALHGNGGAHSAVEMAVLDLVGRASGTRLIDLVTKPRREAVKPMWLLGNKTAEEDVAEAHLRQKEGFEFFKLKIGVKPLATEIAIALAVRDALPTAPLCADANCGLTRADARKYASKTRKPT